jgi:hypothetical protein
MGLYPKKTYENSLKSLRVSILEPHTADFMPFFSSCQEVEFAFQFPLLILDQSLSL